MPATNATLLCHYRYDALDRLTAQGLTNAPPLQRFYCKSRLATEIQGALRQTLFQQGDWLLAQQTQQGIEHDTALLATDLQRSVLNTLKANHQAQPIAYAPYGHRQATNGWMSLMGFNGERPDPLTGHYLLGNGYRAFNPVLMRFNSPDSLSPFGKGGLNSYGYCFGDPINLTDPNGHMPIKPSGIVKPYKNLVFAPANFDNIDNWFETVFENTPKHMRPQFEKMTKNTTPTIKRTNSMRSISTKKHENFDFSDLIGYHGSEPRNTDSLHAGIDPKKFSRHLYYGEGFYSTPTYERTIHYGSKIFGVYTSNQKSLKEGRDYTFHRSPDAFSHGDYVELVIKAPAYDSIRIREIKNRGRVILPRPYEAPF